MRRLLLACTAALVGLSCSSGGGDYNNIYERPKPLGTPIADQSKPETRLKDGDTIRASGVVVIAIDTYDENNGGSVGDIFVQDPVQTGAKGTPWSGLRLYRPTKNPPDLTLAPGQGVDLVGEYQAFAGPPGSPFSDGILVPQAANAALTLTYEGSPPVPIELTWDDLKDPKTALQYASRLVTVKNVEVVGGFSGSRPEAAIFSPDKVLTLASKFFPVHEMPEITPGTTVKQITGVLDYFYSMKLCPRSRADIEL